MKKLNITIIVVLLAIFTCNNTNAQIFNKHEPKLISITRFLVTAMPLEFSSVKINNEVVRTVPRVSFSLPYLTGIPIIQDSDEVSVSIMLPGLYNHGAIFDYEGNRYKRRALQLRATFFSMFLISNKFVGTFTYSFGYNFHYKEKIFHNGRRKDKEILVSEWNSDRIKKFQHRIGVSIIFKNRYSLAVNYAFGNLMNQDFSEEVDGKTIYPYKNDVIKQLTINTSIPFEILLIPYRLIKKRW